MRFLIVLLLAACGVMGQGLQSRPSREAPRSTVPSIEPRERVDSDPLSILQKLESGAAAERQIGYQWLFGKSIDTRDIKAPPAARLSFIQLDQDSDLEAVLLLDVPNAKVAFVFDRASDGWWRVGKFDNRVRDVRQSFERMIEFRDLVGDNDGSDVIVRKWGYGTGVRGNRLSIYRLKGGSLHRVFETMEEQVDAANEPGIHLLYLRTFLYFPDRSETQGSVLVAHQMEAGVPEDQALLPESLVHRGHTVECTVYRWDEKFFMFLQDEPSRKRFCGLIAQDQASKRR